LNLAITLLSETRAFRILMAILHPKNHPARINPIALNPDRGSCLPSVVL
jgi:hypothetical protein